MQLDNDFLDFTSRFKRMTSLQHLCRYTIYNVLSQRRDLIEELPLPPKLKVYLDTPNYLVEVDPSEVSHFYGSPRFPRKGVQ